MTFVPSTLPILAILVDEVAFSVSIQRPLSRYIIDPCPNFVKGCDVASADMKETARRFFLCRLYRRTTAYNSTITSVAECPLRWHL